MGMIADNMIEVVERSAQDITALALDLRSAESVEFITDSEGRAWVNIDGVCILRIGHVNTIIVDTSNTPVALEKMIKP